MARVKSITVIEDELMEPFFIKADTDNYTVMERSFSDGKHRLSKGGVKETSKPVAYLSNFETCLSYIVKQKERLGQQFSSLQEFKSDYTKNIDDMKKYVDQIKGKF